MKQVYTILFVVFIAAHGFAQRLDNKAIRTIEQAMSDELQRGKAELKLNGLIAPFYISYSVLDATNLSINASFGALTRSAESRNRSLNLRLMVGNYQFNDENFSDGGGGIFGGGPSIDMVLPLDDDYDVIRRGFWLATDNLFKEANETITKKKAALERKQLSDEDKNLPDFATAPVAVVTESPYDAKYNKSVLENNIRELSAIFLKYPEIQNCLVSLNFRNSYQFFHNTEGTSYRKPILFCDLNVQATSQAIDDGEPLGLSFTVTDTDPSELNFFELRTRVEKLAKDLVQLIHAKRFNDKEYTGPVLFEDDAASDFLADHLISKLSAKREDVLGGNVMISLIGGSGGNFQKKIGTRVLPVSMSVKDDPLMKPQGAAIYLGAYGIDEEGVVPQPITLVDKGILKTLYMNRTPTKEIKESNGHARSAGGSSTIGPGIVEISDTKAMKHSDMKKELLKRAKENGYDFAFIVRSTDRATLLFSDGQANIDDMLAGEKALIPTLVYKVSVKDGSEELVRGLEISFPTARDLRELITSKERTTIDMGLPGAGGGGFFSAGAKVAGTLIGPEHILVRELEARKKKTSAYPIKPVVSRPD